MFFQTGDHDWVNFNTVRRLSFLEGGNDGMVAFIYFAQPEFLEGKCTGDPDIEISGHYADELWDRLRKIQG